MKFIIGTSDSKNIKVDAMVLADTRALFSASSGLGKSWLMRLIAENVASSVQTILIDPEGEYPTLREKLDLLIVSENGDLRADIRSARLLARRLAETGVSAVIDIYELPGKEDPWLKRRMFVAEFLTELMNLPKKLYHPMLIMVDEAHQFAPEKPTSDTTMWNGQKVNPSLLSRSAVRSMMSAGRKRGIGGILATQRLSKIDKDSIADVRNYFIGGTTLDIDQQRAGDILGMSRAEQVSLRDLDPGTFYAFGPAIDGKGVIQFTSAKVQTTHPKAGQRASIVVPKASTQIAGIVEQFGDLPAAAEEEVKTIDSMKKEIAELTRQLRARPTQVQTQVETKIETIEVPIITDEQMKTLGDYLAGVEGITEELTGKIESLNSTTFQLSAIIAEAKKRGFAGLDKAILATKPAYRNDQLLGKSPITTAVRAIKRAENIPTSESGSLPGPQQRILDAIAWWESIGIDKPKRSIVALLAGYSSVRSKGFANPMGSLKTSGLVQYPDAKSIDLTEAGRTQAFVDEVPQTTEDLHRIIFSRLPGPERRILEVLIEANGEPVDREELAARVGYTSVRSKGFANPMGRLRTIGFIDYPSTTTVKALPVLFLK